MIQPAFYHGRLVALAGQMVAALDESMAAWTARADKGAALNAVQAFTHMMMNVLVRTMFGSGLEPGEAETVGRELAYALDFMMQGMVTNSLPGWLPVPGRARYRRAIRAIDEVVFRVIARGRQLGADDNLCSMLLTAVDEESGGGMTHWP